jgi:hypothetical protein
MSNLSDYTGKGVSQSEVFLSNGTFNVPSGVTGILVTAVGGGSGGNGGEVGVGSSYYGGAGGSAGDVSFRYPLPVTGGGTVTVTVAASTTGGAIDTVSADGNRSSAGEIGANGGEAGYYRNEGRAAADQLPFPYRGAYGGNARSSTNPGNVGGNRWGWTAAVGGGFFTGTCGGAGGGAGFNGEGGAGGDASLTSAEDGFDAAANSGAGGGGAGVGGTVGAAGGNGGSGMVIIEWVE